MSAVTPFWSSFADLASARHLDSRRSPGACWIFPSRVQLELDDNLHGIQSR